MLIQIQYAFRLTSPQTDSEDLGAIQPCVWLAQCREDPVQGTSQASVVVLNVDRSPGDGSACVKFNISGGNVD